MYDFGGTFQLELSNNNILPELYGKGVDMWVIKVILYYINVMWLS